MIQNSDTSTNHPSLMHRFCRKLVMLLAFAFVFLAMSASDADAALTASSSAPNSVTLNWTAPGDDGASGQAAFYDIRYSTATITVANWTSASQVSGEPTPKSVGLAETFTVTGLNPSTTYYFAIKTADEVPNWSVLSNVVTKATTVETIAPSAIDNLSLSNATQTSIQLNWTAVGDDGTTGTATSYDIRRSTSPITDANWATATQVTGEAVPKAAGSAETFVVTGLTGSTTYYFAIKVSDEVPNISGLSNVISGATTGDQTPPAGINDLTASSGSLVGEILLGWTTVGDDGLNGQASAYQIRYSRDTITPVNFTSASLLPNPPAPLASGTQQGLIIQGLQPGMKYFTAVKVYDELANASSVSNVSSALASFNIILDNKDQQVALLSPEPSSVVNTSQPHFRVNNIDQSLNNLYQFDLATDSNFFGLVASSVVGQGDGGMTEWKVETALASNTNYFWRSRANDYQYSATATFTVQPLTFAYPNPFHFAKSSHVVFNEIPLGTTLVLSSISGEPVRVWSDVGQSEIQWDGTDESGVNVGSGVYLWSIAENGLKGKIIVVR
ncbi:MAG: fibronectin type III domain-containing protein [candidate division Zixibacteria bacterium]|nr:fibronectin type III domain-containing protein [candidate division Zixibacteria bacterium]